MKKRITAILLIITMAVMMMAGCGEKEETLTDTIRFINGTYAVITSRNGGDYNLVGGYSAKDSRNGARLQKSLKSSWDVTNEQTAREMIEWLSAKGHNEEVVQTYQDNSMDSFTRSELEQILIEPDYTPEERILYLSTYDAVQKFGDNAILAWDLSRALQLLSWYYLAGYYTYEDAMNQSLEIAGTLQESYTSWNEMMESYFLGYQYWAEESIEDSQSEAYIRYELYENLKKMENGPYSVDWNTQLQKEW